MEKERIAENKMGVMPVNKLLINMSLPIMISMLVQAFYNVVDSIYVAQINENALTAVSLAFPLQNLMIAVAAGTGVGVNALLSKSLGEKNYEKVNKIANNAVFFSPCQLHSDFHNRNCGNRSVLQKSNCRCPDYRVWYPVCGNMLLLVHWDFYAGGNRASFAVYRQDLVYHDCTGHRCNY